MALAETARLIVALQLKDGLSPGVGKAKGELAALEGTAVGASTRGVAPLATHFGKAGTAASKLGGALSHAKSQLGGLISGPLGIIGLGAGLFTIGGLLETSVGRARDFGMEVSRLSKLTGLSVETTSALAAALEHFGVGPDAALRSIGFLEKNVGLLASRKDGIVNFEKSFGLSLTDTNGHIKDANQLILASADYFNNKSIPATTKAAALAKLYGRSWQQLIPFLSAGSKGIVDAEQAAADLGLTLNKTNVEDLAKFKESSRELGTAMGGLELQIGLALVPALNELTKSATKFIANNRTGIVAGFKAAAGFAAQFAKAINDTVIPAIGLIGSAWDKVPGPLKELLIGGFVANKASKFLFDFGIGDILKGGLDLFGKRGATPANPMFVADVTGVGKGIPGVPGGGTGVLSLLPALGLGALIVAAAVPIGEAFANALPDWLKGGSDHPGESESQRRHREAMAAMGGGSTPIDVANLGDDFRGSEPTGVGTLGIDARSAHAQSKAEAGILARAVAAGFRPTAAQIANTLRSNQARDAAARNRQIAAALANVRASERIEAAVRGTTTAVYSLNGVVMLPGDTRSEAHGISRSQPKKGATPTVSGQTGFTVNANVSVSTRDVNTAQTIKNRYGPGSPAQAGAG